MTDLPPDKLAQVDQEIADMDDRLDKAAAAYRKERDYRGDFAAIAVTQRALVNTLGARTDGVDQLAWLLAAAIRRSAA